MSGVGGRMAPVLDATPPPERRPDLDWLRVIAVLLHQTVIVILGYNVVRWRGGLWGTTSSSVAARSS
jgi:hypothetical protein